MSGDGASSVVHDIDKSNEYVLGNDYGYSNRLFESEFFNIWKLKIVSENRTLDKVRNVIKLLIASHNSINSLDGNCNISTKQIVNMIKSKLYVFNKHCDYLYSILRNIDDLYEVDIDDSVLDIKTLEDKPIDYFLQDILNYKSFKRLLNELDTLSTNIDEDDDENLYMIKRKEIYCYIKIIDNYFNKFEKILNEKYSSLVPLPVKDDGDADDIDDEDDIDEPEDISKATMVTAMDDDVAVELKAVGLAEDVVREDALPISKDDDIQDVVMTDHGYSNYKYIESGKNTAKYTDSTTYDMLKIDKINSDADDNIITYINNDVLDFDIRLNNILIYIHILRDRLVKITNYNLEVLINAKNLELKVKETSKTVTDDDYKHINNLMKLQYYLCIFIETCNMRILKLYMIVGDSICKNIIKTYKKLSINSIKTAINPIELKNKDSLVKKYRKLIKLYDKIDQIIVCITSMKMLIDHDRDSILIYNSISNNLLEGSYRSNENIISSVNETIDDICDTNDILIRSFEDKLDKEISKSKK